MLALVVKKLGRGRICVSIGGETHERRLLVLVIGIARIEMRRSAKARVQGRRRENVGLISRVFRDGHCVRIGRRMAETVHRPRRLTLDEPRDAAVLRSVFECEIVHGENAGARCKTTRLREGVARAGRVGVDVVARPDASVSRVNVMNDIVCFFT